MLENNQMSFSNFDYSNEKDIQFLSELGQVEKVYK